VGRFIFGFSEFVNVLDVVGYTGYTAGNLEGFVVLKDLPDGFRSPYLRDIFCDLRSECGGFQDSGCCFFLILKEYECLSRNMPKRVVAFR